MKTLLRIVCMIFFFGHSIYAEAQDAQAANIKRPQLHFTNNDSLYNFGGVPMDLNVTYEFEIKNTGNAPLIISGMSCDSKNVKFKWPEKPIKPEKRGYVVVTYTANGDIGDFDNKIYATSNAWLDSIPLIHIIGAIIPAGDSYTPPSRSTSKVKVEVSTTPLLIKP